MKEQRSLSFTLADAQDQPDDGTDPDHWVHKFGAESWASTTANSSIDLLDCSDRLDFPEAPHRRPVRHGEPRFDAITFRGLKIGGGNTFRPSENGLRVAGRGPGGRAISNMKPFHDRMAVSRPRPRLFARRLTGTGSASSGESHCGQIRGAAGTGRVSQQGQR